MITHREMNTDHAAHAAFSIDEQHRAQQAITAARVFAVASVMIVVYFSPDSLARNISLLVLALYAAFAVVLLQARSGTLVSLALPAHLVDTVAASTIALLGTGTDGPFFLLLLFPILVAAYRWGFAPTIATATLSVAVLVVETAILGEAPHILQGQLELSVVTQYSTFVLMAGALVGYIAQSERRFRAEAMNVAAIVGGADLRAGVRRTMGTMFDAILRLLSARRAVLVVRDRATDRVFLWEVHRSGREAAAPLQLKPEDFGTYMCGPDAAAWHAVRQRGPAMDRYTLVAVSGDGEVLKPTLWTFPGHFLDAAKPSNQFMAFDVELGTELTGRLFVFDPAIGSDPSSVLAFGRRLIGQLTPAVQNVYAMRRVRATAHTLERGRIARELHDGVIQTVTAAEIQVAALALRLENKAPDVVRELGRLRDVLRQEVSQLRDLMQQMRPLDLAPDKLVGVLAEFVQRFQRETGIAAHFVTRLDRVSLSPRACREVARIVQEALVNVRVHSGARNVFVRLSAENGDYHLSIEDDGRGFPFTGRLSQTELEAVRKGPQVINERVRLLGGALTVESDPGRGARLEIAVPLSPYAA